MVDEMGGFPKDVNAFIGKNSQFVGKLTFDGTVRIDGKVEGEVFSKGTLIIGPGAQIEAKINVDVVIISGTVHGDVFSKKRVELRAPGKLYGNIAAPSLVVEQGVIFEGKCKMEDLAKETMGQAEKAAKPVTSAAPAAPAPVQGTLGSVKASSERKD